jgi:hypothetical protein
MPLEGLCLSPEENIADAFPQRLIRCDKYKRMMTATGTQTNSANHELSVSQSLRMINPSMSMNRNVAMLKKNNQPAICFSDFGIFFHSLISQFHKIVQQLQADRLACLQMKLRGGFNYFTAKDSKAGTSRLVRPLNL